MADNAKRTGAAVEAHYQFLLWLLPTVEKFPRSHKFMLGDRIELIALGVLEALIEATYTRDRAEALRRGNLGIEKLRFLIQLAAASVIARSVSDEAIHENGGRPSAPGLLPPRCARGRNDGFGSARQPRVPPT